jgi:hypothetical protein
MSIDNIYESYKSSWSRWCEENHFFYLLNFVYLLSFSNMDRNGLRNIILHECKLGHGVTTTTANFNKAWGDGTIHRKIVRDKYNQFSFDNFDPKNKEVHGPKVR